MMLGAFVSCNGLLGGRRREDAVREHVQMQVCLTEVRRGSPGPGDPRRAERVEPRT